MSSLGDAATPAPLPAAAAALAPGTAIGTADIGSGMDWAHEEEAAEDDAAAAAHEDAGGVCTAHDGASHADAPRGVRPAHAHAG